jgi:RNA polymerase sigma-70 factor, ECF subfamily
MLSPQTVEKLLPIARLPADAEDTGLVGRMDRGDVGALHRLYRQCAGRVMAIAVRILEDRVEAEDIVQETFLEIWKRALEYKAQRGRLLSWIVVIARSRAIDRLRSRDTAWEVARLSTQLPDEGQAPAPLELAVQRLDRKRVIDALSALPPAQRSAIELAYFEGLTQREISERTGDPLGTVKTRVRLALEKLQASLAGEAAR